MLERIRQFRQLLHELLASRYTLELERRVEQLEWELAARDGRSPRTVAKRPLAPTRGGLGSTAVTPEPAPSRPPGQAPRGPVPPAKVGRMRWPRYKQRLESGKLPLEFQEKQLERDRALLAHELRAAMAGGGQGPVDTEV
jgi:hypothetical protein